MNLKSLEKKGFKYVCGVDETGRGPLAGPLSLSFFFVSIKDYKKVLNPLLKLGLDDSKKLKEEKREELIFLLKSKNYTNSMISAAQIDKHKIAKSYQILIKRMLPKIPKKTYFLLDGSIKFPEEVPHEVIIGGDGIEPTIMAASVVSKVKRDRKMKVISKKYPKYEFEVNKGYGTKKHREAIKKFGLSKEHRKSFCENLIK
jgi:ribonuclease HII